MKHGAQEWEAEGSANMISFPQCCHESYPSIFIIQMEKGGKKVREVTFFSINSNKGN